MTVGSVGFAACQLLLGYLMPKPVFSFNTNNFQTDLLIHRLDANIWIRMDMEAMAMKGWLETVQSSRTMVISPENTVLWYTRLIHSLRNPLLVTIKKKNWSASLAGAVESINCTSAKGQTPLTIVQDMTQKYLIVRLQPWRFEECRVALHCHYSQVLSNLEW